MASRPVLVTGAGSGIGAALATRLVGAGLQVIGVDRAAEMPEGVEPICCDLTDPQALAVAVDQLRSRFPRLEGLAHVAGVPGTADAATVLAVNWLAPRRLTEALLDSLEGGAIVSVASLAGHHPEYADQVAELAELADEDLQGWAQREGLTGPRAYDLSKKLLIHHGKVLAARLLPRGVRSNTISPGPVHTPILGDFQSSMNGSVERSEHLVGRHASADEIAAPAAFLLSDEASWINGVDLVADGGLIASRTAPTPGSPS
ncbi:SDR family oxidoreductase [Saccharopolyspora sp. WRP15-2]|uniref:SDR family oxidoreductase n=1 Tax=Saccharopolyspora oryzae TaxID=2997343 RepID=A0ABT4V4C9_9PSEU|nr:SDR family oxidoreductase [Saccharopolyspora oryzae]MDA3628813.1 SDR family oxidoreductase [Saccharopolyspora oryzae]